MRLILGIFVWKRGSLANSEQKKAAAEDKERAEFLTIKTEWKKYRNIKTFT